MPSHQERVKRNYRDSYWEWWDLPFFTWYVRINESTGQWVVGYKGKIILSEILK